MQNDLALTEATYYILLSLFSPQHGYGIMQQTEELSGGRVRLAAGTLYGALKGLTVLKNELERLRELVNNGDMILGGTDNG